jgi:hypothetical protein
MTQNNLQRYEIIFVSFSERKTKYIVATWFGEHKAIAMATSCHVTKPKSHAIYKIQSRCLEDSQLANTDLVDRHEW